MSDGSSIDDVLAAMHRRLEARGDALAMVETGGFLKSRLRSRGRRVTCAALLERLEATLSGLRHLGVAPGDAVLFAVRPGIDCIVLMAALLRVGANVVALDPGVGRQLFAERIRALAPRWVIAEAVVFAASAPGPLRWLLRRLGLEIPDIRVPGAGLMRIGRRWPGVPRSTSLTTLCAEPRPRSRMSPLPAARDVLTIFTSGTTAAPKAVVHTSASLGAACSIIAGLMALDESHVVYSTQTHLMLAALLGGATCIVPPQRLDASRYVDDVGRFGVTHGYAVPFELAAVVRELERRRVRLPAHFQKLVLGSAPILQPFLARLRAACDERTEVWCAYAMTEMFPVALIESRDKLRFAGEGDLVGRPVAGVAAMLAADGELVVSGSHLFDRYLGDGHVVRHRTGDLARIGPDGAVVLLGRKKDMIIRGHYNIYPSLYEPAVGAIDGVESCAFVGVPDSAGADERVVLAVQPAPGADAAALLKRVRRALEDGTCSVDPFARPDEVLVCDLPHSGRSHKLDRRVLVAWVIAKRPSHGK